MHRKNQVKVNNDELCNVDTDDSYSFILMVMNKEDEDVVDYVHITHKDHNEGICIWPLNPLYMNLLISIILYVENS